MWGGGAPPPASDYVALLSTRRLRPRAIIQVDDAPGWAAISPRGTRCFVANTRADTLSVISLRRRKEIRRLEMGDGPKQIEAARLPHRVVCTLPRALGCTIRRDTRSAERTSATKREHPTPPGPEFEGDPAEDAFARLVVSAAD